MLRDKSPTQQVTILKKMLSEQSEHINFLSEILCNAMDDNLQPYSADSDSGESSLDDGYSAGSISEDESLSKTPPDPQDVMFTKAIPQHSEHLHLPSCNLDSASTLSSSPDLILSDEEHTSPTSRFLGDPDISAFCTSWSSAASLTNALPDEQGDSIGKQLF